MGRGISFQISNICALNRMKIWLSLMMYAFPTLHPSQPHTPEPIDEMSPVTQTHLKSWKRMGSRPFASAKGNLVFWTRRTRISKSPLERTKRTYATATYIQTKASGTRA